MAVKSVDQYIEKHPEWASELAALRKMILSTGMEEAIKWSRPVYTVNGKNVVGISGFKNHYGLWFFQGALLKENTSLLINAQEGKTKSMRQIKLEKGQPVPLQKLKLYVLEAKNNAEKGREIKPSKKSRTELPQELQTILISDKDFNIAFSELSPGKQREYCEYIDEAKQDTTKLKRLAKIRPMILEGRGLNDKYKKT